MSSESTFVVNVKTKAGTIITVRGDTFETLSKNISDAVAGKIETLVGALEDVIIGPDIQKNMDYVASTLGAQPTFAPVPPPIQPVASGAPAPTCTHGAMVLRTAKQGPRAGKNFWACKAPMNAPDKCKPINA